MDAQGDVASMKPKGGLALPHADANASAMTSTRSMQKRWGALRDLGWVTARPSDTITPIHRFDGGHVLVVE